MPYDSSPTEIRRSHLMTTWQEIRDAYASYGRKLKAAKGTGDASQIDRRAYKELHEWVRGLNTALRHRKWWQAYCEAYDEALYQASSDGLTNKQALKRARIEAEKDVVAKFPDEATNTRTIRVALAEYLSD
jgi:hypothetical protein